MGSDRGVDGSGLGFLHHVACIRFWPVADKTWSLCVTFQGWQTSEGYDKLLPINTSLPSRSEPLLDSWSHIKCNRICKTQISGYLQGGTHKSYD